MQKIGIYFAPGSHRSTIVANAMAEGAGRLGLTFDHLPSSTAPITPRHDVAVFYGLAGGLRQIYEQYRKSRKVLFLDLGYFGRRKRTRYDGYHKLVLNDRHPTAYFQEREHSIDRFRAHGIQIQPWRKGGKHVLVIGMSAKAAAHDGFQPQQWERETIAQLAALTDRPIIYRPKPNWTESRPIPGSHYGVHTPLAEHFADAHCVVAHHSNVAVDALLAGIPCICPAGVASALSLQDLTQIETPIRPEGREQWAADLAFTQYSLDEMLDGTAWRYALEELI